MPDIDAACAETRTAIARMKAVVQVPPLQDSPIVSDAAGEEMLARLRARLERHFEIAFLCSKGQSTHDE